MAFLAPLFLVGLAALAVPLLVHLTHRQRREPVQFPSLMFLRRVELRTTRRQRLRHWLLFALRSLAFLLLALAFARPFLRSGDAATAAGRGGRELVILLDDSFSMGYGDRWARAQAAARAAIDGLGAGDRATLVRFAARAEALGQPAADRGALHASLDALRPGAGVTRFAPAISLAQGIVGRSDRPRREVHLISDFQRGAWAPGEELRLPRGTTLTTVDVGDEPTANIAITGVDFQRGFADGRERVTATARLTNRGEAPVRDVPVTLAIGGREVARETVTIGADAAATVRLGPFALADSVERGELRAGTDALPGDNLRYFTIERGAAIGVLVVQDPTASPSRTLYLRQALSLGADPAYRVEILRGDALAAADLTGRSVVILDDAPPPRGEGGRRLRDFVREGGGLIVTTGERARAGDWTSEVAELLPARFGETVDRSAARGGRLGALDRGHPVLEPFSAPRSGTFSTARFFRYRPLALSDSASAVMRFDDGAVALAERRVGRGRVLLWGSTLDNIWNDLPLQPVFLPWLHRLVEHAAGWREERPWRTVGEAVDVATEVRGAAVTDAAAEYVALAPSGQRVQLTAGASSLELAEPGIWEIRRFGARDAPAALVAVNVDPAESDLSRIPAAEIAAAVAPAGGESVAADTDAPLTAAEREARQSLWWWALLGAALLLAAETLLSNRLTRVAR